MYAFFVLGLVPGTNFQITFQVWLDVILLMVAGLATASLFQLERQRKQQLVIVRYAPFDAGSLHTRLAIQHRAGSNRPRPVTAIGRTVAALPGRTAGFVSACQPLILTND